MGSPTPQVFDPGPPDPIGGAGEDRSGPDPLQPARRARRRPGGRSTARAFRSATLTTSMPKSRSKAARSEPSSCHAAERAGSSWSSASATAGRARSEFRDWPGPSRRSATRPSSRPWTSRRKGAFTLQRYDRGAWGVEGGLRIDRRGPERRPGRPSDQRRRHRAWPRLVDRVRRSGLHQCVGLRSGLPAAHPRLVRRPEPVAQRQGAHRV